jgi:hypothetical protein
MIDRAEMIVLDKGRCGHRHSKNQSLARLAERKRRVAGAPHFFPPQILIAECSFPSISLYFWPF